MKNITKIMHIDRQYRVTLFVIMDGSTIRSQVPLDKAIAMLKSDHFDLILSEPQQRAILDPGPGRPVAGAGSPGIIAGQQAGRPSVSPGGPVELPTPTAGEVHAGSLAVNPVAGGPGQEAAAPSEKRRPMSRRNRAEGGRSPVQIRLYVERRNRGNDV